MWMPWLAGCKRLGFAFFFFKHSDKKHCFDTGNTSALIAHSVLHCNVVAWSSSLLHPPPPSSMSLTLATNRISLLLLHVPLHASQAVSQYKLLSAGCVAGQRWRWEEFRCCVCWHEDRRQGLWELVLSSMSRLGIDHIVKSGFMF